MSNVRTDITSRSLTTAELCDGRATLCDGVALSVGRAPRRRPKDVSPGVGICNVISGLSVARVVVSGRIVYGWKFIEQPLGDAVAKTMAVLDYGFSTIE